MQYNELVAAVKANGFVMNEQNFCGQYAGYPFFMIVNYRGAEVHSLSAVYAFSDKVSMKTFRTLRTSMNPGSFARDNNLPSQLRYTLSEKDIAGMNNTLFNMMLMAMQQLSRLFAANNLFVPSTCPICKQGAVNGLPTDSLALVGAGYVPVHRHCLEQSAFLRIEQAKENDANGNRVLGTIGAILGTLVGMLPTLLCIIFLERIYAAAYALIPIGGYFGYKWFKGKLDAGVLITVIILSILSVFACEMITVECLLYKEFGVWLSVSELFGTYFEFMSFGDMLQDMAMPFLFTLFGLALSWGIIRRTNQFFAKDAEATLKTLMVVDPEAAERNKAAMQNGMLVQNSSVDK